MLTAGNNEYTYVDKNRYFNTGFNDFTVKSNQSIKWSTSGTISGSVTTNDTTCIGKVNATTNSSTKTNSSATITATTVGGQKLEVYCVAAVN